MITVIAEKPSVAREIASILGANSRQDGYLDGNGYSVTWAFGHLVGLAMPEAYGFVGFQKENLPIIPTEFILKVRQVRSDKGYKDDEGVVKQINTIKTLFSKSDSIIVATDAGREGELIFRYIYEYIGIKKPFKRLWISSLTEKAIRDGLSVLKEGKAYDSLFYAAKARSEADWLVGINSSQALTISANKGVFSLGRVQTPTLAMICSRYLENKNFVSTPYWQIKIQTEKSEIQFSAISLDKMEEKEKAKIWFESINDKKIKVDSVECKPVNQEPPLLYDLTTLQKEANTKHSFSADKTLSIAQKLYEGKFITYPRTGSRFLSDDVYESIPQLIGLLKTHVKFGHYAASMSAFNKRSVNDAKVTDHHAIIITDHLPSNGLGEDENIIYEMIVGRMLESFSDKCIKEATTIILSVNEVKFSARGSITKQQGWRGVYNENSEGEDEQKLPMIETGEELLLLKKELLEKKTKPKPLHTESSLLAAMETAGKELEDEEQRIAMKDSGIGTPATRAAIIETLFSREYIKRDKKSLVPTEKGIGVYEIVKDKKIADVAMTGEWENLLAQIENMGLSNKDFSTKIEDYTKEIISELLGVTLVIEDKDKMDCPICKQGKLTFYPKVVKCSQEKCITVFRSFCEKMLTDAQIKELILKGKTKEIKGFKSKKGNTFNAVLALGTDNKITIEFK